MSAPKPENAYAPVESALAALFSPVASVAGVSVNEDRALGLSAVWRAVNLIAGTLASLPMRSFTNDVAGSRKQVASVFDEPDGPDGQTAFEWKETAFAHLVLYGKCGALKLRNEAGGLARLQLVHPTSFREVPPDRGDRRAGRWPAGGLWFDVRLDDGTSRRLDADDFWYVPALAMDGQTGRGILNHGQNPLGTAVAGDVAAGKSFSQGAHIAGMVTPDGDEGLDDGDPAKIKQDLDRAVHGYENVGRIAVIARRLKFQPWQMSNADAQFMEQRKFSVEEVARLTGVPPHLLMQTDKQTSWGTGVDEQNRGLSRYVLGHWASRFEQRASRLLARPRWVEFDFAGLERPNIAVEIDLLIKQVQAGLLTVDEARAIRNLPPLPAAGTREGSDDASPAE